MPDFREYEDVVFIAGQNFQSEYGLHLAGTEVEEAHKFQNLQVLIDAKFIYPIAPDKGYNYLPPNLFNHINVKDEVMAKLQGAMNPNPDHFQDGKPAAVLLAEQEADQRQSEDRGHSKEAKKVAAERMAALATPDASVSAVTKSKDAKDKPAYEILEEQGQAVEDEQKDAVKEEQEEAPKPKAPAKKTTASKKTTKDS